MTASSAQAMYHRAVISACKSAGGNQWRRAREHLQRLEALPAKKDRPKQADYLAVLVACSAAGQWELGPREDEGELVGDMLGSESAYPSFRDRYSRVPH